MAHHPLSMQLPLATGLKADQGIELLTWGTPNGFKASIMLEELKEAYGKEYTAQAITLPKGIQKQPWYLKLNPTGKIPTIVDHDKGGVSVAESGAILQYLVEHYDPEYKLSFAEPVDAAKADQWVHFMAGGLGPNMANNVRFYRFLPQRHAFPIQMYHREGLQLFDVLEKSLEGRDYLVGPGRGQFSHADIANFAHVNSSRFLGLGGLERWPNLQAWQERIWARPGVKNGVDCLYPAVTVNEVVEKKIAEDAEYAAAEQKLKDVLDKALEDFPPMGPPPPK